jgi:hypothetical protein
MMHQTYVFFYFLNLIRLANYRTFNTGKKKTEVTSTRRNAIIKLRAV